MRRLIKACLTLSVIRLGAIVLFYYPPRGRGLLNQKLSLLLFLLFRYVFRLLFSYVFLIFYHGSWDLVELLRAFSLGSFEFLGLFMDPNGPNAGVAEEIVAEDEMGTVEDSHEERDGPNLHQLRREVEECDEASRECCRRAQDSLELAENLINEANYRESLPDRGPAWRERTDQLIAAAQSELDFPEEDLEMAQELEEDKKEALGEYHAALDAEYNRLLERGKALQEENERLRERGKALREENERLRERGE